MTERGTAGRWKLPHSSEIIKTLGPWSHNLQIKHIPAAPENSHGDLARKKWAGFAGAIAAALIASESSKSIATEVFTPPK
ncbi:MAG: hypothetical protein ACR2JE_06055 [Acidobacteriaceae bacterium]